MSWRSSAVTLTSVKDEGGSDDRKSEMLGYVVALLVGVAIAGAFAFGLVRAFRRLAGVEVLALFWWGAIAILAFTGIATEVHFVSGLAGVLMLTLGMFLALNMRGIADRLGRRRMGFGSLWTR
jgi:hypothetical protein